MRPLRITLVGLLVFLAVSCGSSTPKEMILGKWEFRDEVGQGVFEFEKNGSLRGNFAILPIQGTYQWLDDRTLQVVMNDPRAALKPGAHKSQQLTRKFTLISISRNELVVTDAANGRTIKFKRVS